METDVEIGAVIERIVVVTEVARPGCILSAGVPTGAIVTASTPGFALKFASVVEALGIVVVVALA